MAGDLFDTTVGFQIHISELDTQKHISIKFNQNSKTFFPLNAKKCCLKNCLNQQCGPVITKWNFWKNTLWGQAMGCLYCDLNLLYIIPLSVSWCIQYHTVTECNIMATVKWIRNSLLIMFEYTILFSYLIYHTVFYIPRIQLPYCCWDTFNFTTSRAIFGTNASI